MKRLTYFQCHRNKKPKKLPFYISKTLVEKCLDELIHQHKLLLMMQNENPF